MKLVLPLVSSIQLRDFISGLQNLSRRPYLTDIEVDTGATISSGEWREPEPGSSLLQGMSLGAFQDFSAGSVDLLALTALILYPEQCLYMLSMELHTLRTLSRQMWGLHDLKTPVQIMDAMREFSNLYFSNILGQIKINSQEPAASLPWACRTPALRLLSKKPLISWQQWQDNQGNEIRVLELA